MLFNHFSSFALFALSFLATPSSTARTANPQRVLLCSIKSLTLRKDQLTTSNRAPPIPQLKCVGGPAKSLYDIDILRCRNAGSGYGDDDIQWTCTASLPEEFKLGSTEVMCEGFASPEDPYVLKGSCGVEYRLMLTDLGEKKYGRRKGGDGGVWDGLEDFQKSKVGDLATILFWIVFVGVLLWILWAIFVRDRGVRGAGRGVGGGRGTGGGGGGGGDGFDDPPPPYDYNPPPSKPRTSASTYTRQARPAARAQGQQQGWRPGFWTGALGGAAAGYMAGGRRNQTQEQPQNQGYAWGNGEGSSGWGAPRSGGSSSSSSNSSYGPARHESSGFGGTTRR